ncbi:MAG: FAD binding domain-containing protein [Anaerolineae bacterium]|nr:FAD binding domain-containing protein [Thermoflexales bacterium]MCX7939789.1 FAD binding domain-containing protein [Thermoflexales bacterium]MDW8054869.1 FAD binding domain-containing protein [Anaerolineae bacterium]
MQWEVLRPRDVFEAVALLKRPTPRTVVMGGGTWLLQQPRPEIGAVVDVSGLGLDKVLVEGNLLRLGAAVTHAALIEHALVGAHAEGALHIIGKGARYTPDAWRARATLAGAIVTAQSASPLVVALLACDAEVVVAGARDRTKEIQSPRDFWKVIPLAGFLSYGHRVLEEGTLITEIRLPIPSPDTRSVYVESEHAPINLAASFAIKDGIVGNVRVALGGIAPKPLRLSRLEFGLERKKLADWLDSELEAQLALLQLEPTREAHVRALVHNTLLQMAQ